MFIVHGPIGGLFFFWGCDDLHAANENALDLGRAS